jgi:hypothetical protein
LGTKFAFQAAQVQQTQGGAQMNRFFRYQTCEFLIAAGFMGLLARSLFPTASRAMFSILHEIPWNL